MTPVISLKDRVLAAAAATPSPTRRQGRHRAAWLLALSVAAGGTIFDLMGGLAHSRVRPLALTLRMADGWALVSSVLTWAVARRSASLVQSPGMLRTAVLACPIALYAWMAHFHGMYAEPPAAGVWSCFVCTLSIAAMPLTAFFALRRGMGAHQPEVLGAAGGAASGAWAGVAVMVWCPTTDGWHTLVGHVAPIALLIVVGSLIGASALGEQS